MAQPFAARKSTTLFLEDWVADMIDDELYREKHPEEFEKKWMDKNRNLVVKHLPETVLGDEYERDHLREVAKDKKMARHDPQRYCADRCVATGNCDVYEDVFQLSPDEVLAFCNDCVLSEEKEECDIPDAFYEFGDQSLYLAP